MPEITGAEDCDGEGSAAVFSLPLGCCGGCVGALSCSAVVLKPAGRPEAKCTCVRPMRFKPPVATMRGHAPCVVPCTTT